MSLYETLFVKRENKLKTGLGGMVIITILLAAVFNYEASAIDVVDQNELNQLITNMATNKQIDWTTYSKTIINLDSIEDYSDETSEENRIVQIARANIVRVTFTLTWQDEAASDGRHTNTPDSFTLGIAPPNGTDTTETSSNTQGGQGTIEITINTFNLFNPNSEPYYNGTGSYEVRIVCDASGDQEPIVPDLLNIRTILDNGNDWTLNIEYEVFERA